MKRLKLKHRFLLVIIFAMLSFWSINTIAPYSSLLWTNRYSHNSCPVTGDRWIVTTVVESDPYDVENILNKLDWNLMILGHQSTPKNWSWQFSSSRLFYLSFEEQMKSKLESARFIKSGVNAQKNIGYLIAIFCGAKVIYDFNGETKALEFGIGVYPHTVYAKDIYWLGFSAMRSRFINIYGIFGHPAIWPRGLPVSELQNISEDGWSSLRRNQDETLHPYIQQQLIDSRPDVDEVARYVHRKYLKRLVFDQMRGPIALEPFTFSPYNAKSTIHLSAVFWGLYLPVTMKHEFGDIIRGFFTQRLLWDIGGHLLFTPISSKNIKGIRNVPRYPSKEFVPDIDISRLVHFLYHWRDNETRLSQRIRNLMKVLVQNKLMEESELQAMQAWLNDLSTLGYEYPSIIGSMNDARSKIRIKRSAVCVTGLSECIEEVWAKNELKLRQRIKGDLDVFLYLSSGEKREMDNAARDSYLRIKQARLYNATVNIIHEDTADIDPGFPPTCRYEYPFTLKHKIVLIEQERLAQANCYRIVREYEKKTNVRYQLLIRARSDSVFTRLPKTFERDGKFSPDQTIIVPDEHHYYGINDRFAIGPMETMQHYMSRWHCLSHCLTQNVHPESFLEFILKIKNATVVRDPDVSLVQVPHSKTQCH